jgi:tRNA nucleotidyltransferase/poly(A) polymerase
MIKLPPEIQNDLDQITEVARELAMKVYVVGGLPRDLVSGKGVTPDTDLDITEAEGNAFDLAFFVSAKYDLPEPKVYEASGTAMVIMPSGRMVEFHNAYFNVPHIIDQLYKRQIKPTSLNKDVYSRDFTINTLLFDPEEKTILDLTGMGIKDINDKILRCPIDAKKTIAISPNRILRGIRFKIEMGMTEDEDYAREVFNFIPQLVDYLKKNPDGKMISSTVAKTMKANPNLAVQEYQKLGIMQYLPHNTDTDNVMKEQIFGTTMHKGAAKNNKMLQHLLDEREKHKEYVRRKRSEEKKTNTEKMEILNKARTGYYLLNPEPEYVKDRRTDKKRQLHQYIKNRDYRAVK